jgi:broad specificity phosphatase PhoE
VRGNRRLLTLFIVRHGETDWNKEGRIQGRLNSHLTEKGRYNAKVLGERLNDIDFAKIITSPSGRTIETTELIVKDRDVSVQTNEMIMEMDMGPWQGLLKSEIREQYPDAYECFLNSPQLYQNGDAESFIDIYKRAEAFLLQLKSSKQTGNLLIVTHGLFIKTLFLIVKGIEIKDFWTEPTVEGTSLSIVKMDPEETKLILEGDMSHAQLDNVLK